MNAVHALNTQIPLRHIPLRGTASGHATSTAASAIRKRLRVALRCVRGPNTLPQSAYIDPYHTLLSASPVCSALVSESTPSGTRGLIADRPIPAGHIVLEVPESNVLRVPKRAECVSEWREWLKVYTAAHGPVPSALVSFVAGNQSTPENQSISPLNQATGSTRGTQ